jgi:putative tricarboxylic transport membrane protein
MLMIERPEMFWFILGALVLATFFMLVFGLTGIRLFVKIVELPRAVLFPLILLLSIVGAFAVNNSIIDVYFMLGFGVLGYFMKMYGYQVGPVILGVILSRLIDDNWRRAIISEQESLPRLFHGIFTSPLSAVLMIAVILVFVSNTPLWAWGKRRLSRGRS